MADFLIEDEDLDKEDEEDDDDDEENEEKNESHQLFKSKTINSGKDTDVVKCGMMKKKAHTR